jgi:hypothetical protein
MASFFRNKLYSDIPVSEVAVLTTNVATRSTVIGLSLSNKIDTIVTANIRLENNTVGTISVTNTSGQATLTGITDLVAENISVGDFITGTGVQVGAKVAAKTNTGIDQNTITMTLPSAATVTSARFYSSSYFIKDVIIPPNQSMRVVNGGEKLILATNMTMYINSNSADSLDLVMSYVDII